jgi:hypothetical protein
MPEPPCKDRTAFANSYRQWSDERLVEAKSRYLTSIHVLAITHSARGALIQEGFRDELRAIEAELERRRDPSPGVGRPRESGGEPTSPTAPP